MYAAIGNDAHHMQLGRRRGFHPGHGRVPDRIARELFFGKQLVQADQLLIHNPAGADVFVADFRVAHLAVRQTNVQTAGRHQGVGVFCM